MANLQYALDGSVKGIFRTKDQGANWEQLGEDAPYSYVDLLGYDSNGRLWIDLYNQLFYSIDDGATWVLAFEVEGWISDFLETPDGSLWIAHSKGLMRSLDGGLTWRDENVNDTHSSVLALAWNEATGEILAGIGNGGLYRGLLEPEPQYPSNPLINTPKLLNLNAFPNPTTDRAQVSFELQENVAVRLVLFDQLGRKVMDLLDEQREEGLHEIEADLSSLAPGVYFFRLETPRLTIAKSLLRVR